MMKVENVPFPHIIIDNYFTDEEYNLVWKEINFLEDKLKNSSDLNYLQEGPDKYLTNSTGLILDSVYYDRSVSDILRICTDKLFYGNLYESVKDNNEYWGYLSHSNVDFTKLRKYTNHQGYQEHQDFWVNILVSTTLQKNNFKGGELFFPRHNYEIPTENNKTIIFPGWVTHSIKPIISGERYAITNYIHCRVPN